MEKIYVGETEVEGGTVFYFMLKGGDFCLPYGIQVVRLRDFCTVYNVTDSEEKCLSLIRAMQFGKVTPLTAEDIISDWKEQSCQTIPLTALSI